MPAPSGSPSVPTRGVPPEVKQSKSCQPERSNVAEEVFWISTYSSNCEAAVRRRSLEMTTLDGDAADAEGGVH